MRRPVHNLTRPGWAIVGAVAALYVLGLASIYASESGGPTPLFSYKQLIFLLGSLVASVVVVRLGFERIYRSSYAIFGVALVLLVPLAVARLLHFEFGGLIPNIRGSYRWIRLPGFQLQPSEFMKVAYILALAWYLRYRLNYRTLRGLTVPFVASVVPMILILMEPDLGTVLLMMPVLFAMLYVAGARVRHLALIALLGLALAPVFWMKMQPYQRLRITAVLLQSEAVRNDIARDADSYRILHPDPDALRREARQWRVSSGMQMVRSKAALGSGGLLGRGWGQGTFVEYNFLPDRHNDFVFALIGHQWGLLGCLLVLACYAVIVVSGAVIATDSTDPVGRLLAAGVAALLASQVLINVGMCIGLMPVTGMTLPFVSYGGSSLFVNFIAVALLISVARHRPFTLSPHKPFDFEDRVASFPPPHSEAEDYSRSRRESRPSRRA